MQLLSKGEFDVEVAVSPLAGMKGVVGYHSSVLVCTRQALETILIYKSKKIAK